MSSLVLKRASASRSSGEWNDGDFDVLADGTIVGRIMKAAAVPVGMSWMWTLAFTASRRRARPRWRRSRRAGGGSSAVEAEDCGRSNQHPALLERQDCAVAACYRSTYAPRTAGAYDSHHRTAGIAGRTRRRGGGVAGGGTRAQQPAMPLVGFFLAARQRRCTARRFRRGLANPAMSRART